MSSSTGQLKGANARYTRQQIKDLKKKGSIVGWFGKAALGRPPKKKVTLPKNDAATQGTSKRKDAPSTTSSTTKRPRTNWKSEDNFALLRDAVLGAINGSANLTTSTAVAAVAVPASTLKDNIIYWHDAAAKYKVPVETVTMEMILEFKKPLSLLTDDEHAFLADCIRTRDHANNGMSRHEAIRLIQELAQTSDFKKCENHYDYAVRMKKLNGLKRDGRVTTAQPTTTKRSQIRVEQQLRWHTTVEAALAEQRRLNLPADDFEKVTDSFFGNLDESCFMANADGKVKVIAASNKSKTEKITDDCRASITSVRIGMASGEEGPYIFLAKGQKIERASLKGDLSKRARTIGVKLPVGSCVIMSPNAYMTDEVYLKLVPPLCKGIRQMPVIKDHPEWWVVISMDGFGSHVNVHRAQEIFSEHKILVIKEEGDTSQVNQAYDQQVAKADKAKMRQNLELVRRQLGGNKLDQWVLIQLAANAQAKVERQCWIQSHNNVNTNPKTRIPFADWIKKLDKKGVLLSGEQFFVKRTSLYDAMPACWQRLSVEDRHSVITCIKKIYDRADELQQPLLWTAGDVKDLFKYCALDDIVKLRACYLTAKIDPSVIVGGDNVSAVVVAKKDSVADSVADYFTFMPPKLTAEFKASIAGLPARQAKDPLFRTKAQKKLFDHMCNKACESEWNNDKGRQPSAHINVEVSQVQQQMLNPSYKHVLMGFICYDVRGEGAKQKIAKRRINLVEGNVNSYSRCLNDPGRLASIKEMNQLAASVAEVTADQEKAAAERKEAAVAKSKDKEKKKAEEAAAEAKKKEDLRPALEELMNEFASGEKTAPAGFDELPKTQLVNILKYWYDSRPKGMANMTKSMLVELVMKLYDPSHGANT